MSFAEIKLPVSYFFSIISLFGIVVFNVLDNISNLTCSFHFSYLTICSFFRDKFEVSFFSRYEGSEYLFIYFLGGFFITTREEISMTALKKYIA